MNDSIVASTATDALGQFHLFLDQLQEAVVVLDGRGVVIYANAAMSGWLGSAREQGHGGDLFDHIDVEGRSRAAAMWSDLVGGRSERQHMRLHVRRPDGSGAHIEVAATALRTDGRSPQVMMTVRDITDDVEQVRRLRTEEQRFRSLVSAMDDIVFMLDREGRHTGVFGRWLERAGMTPDMFLGRTARQILGDDGAEVHEVAVAQAVTGVSATYTWSYEEASGRRYVQTTLSPIFDDDDTVSGLVGVGRDTTSLHTMTEDLELLTTALEQSPVCVVLTDAEAKIQYVNPVFEQITGYRLSEVLGANPNILQSGDTPEETYRALWATLRSGETWSGIFCNRKKDGTKFWESAVISPVRSVGGEITHFLAVKEDITSQRAAEEALRTSEDNYRRLFMSHPHPMWVYEVGSLRFLEVNDAAVASYGYTREEFLGMTIEDIRPPEDLGRLRENLVQKTPVLERSGVWRHRTRDGRVIDAEISSHRIAFEGREARIVMAQDVTEREVAAKALRESEERYRRLFQETTSAVFFSRVDGTLRNCNPAFLAMFGFRSIEDALIWNVEQLYANPDDRTQLLERIATERSVEGISLDVLKVDGTPVHVVASVSGQFDADGRLTGLQGYLIDDTQRHVLQRQLFQAQKMESLGTLAGGIAHDFNNILGIILAHASLVPTYVTRPEKLTAASDTIAKACDRGAGLVRQLMTFARLNEPVRELIRLTEHVDDVLTLLRETFPKFILMEPVYATPSPIVNADPVQFHQVLLNLCVNARDAMMPDGGRLEIRTRIWSGKDLVGRHPDAEAGDYAEITVSDTGSGMDEATRARIFDPFFTTKPKGRGTGLGLATVYGIVRAHQGFVEVESEPGFGTTFRIFLPAAPSPAGPSMMPADHASVSQGSETVLLVEDEEPLREAMQTGIEAHGYSVIVAADGPEALALLMSADPAPNVVITDFGLPKQNGNDLIDEIRKLRPDLPVVVASGYLDPEQRRELLDRRVSAILIKPVRTHLIVRALREALDAAGG